MIFGAPLLLALTYLALFAWQIGFKLIPGNDLVAVVQVDGEISHAGLASAQKIVPALTTAFERKNVKAVLLSIDSAGGAAVEAERIARAIDRLKAKHAKPIYAVINNLGASAAYLIALHTDRIYAGNFSVVGSVGAVLTGWDLHRALERVAVSQRIYASGKLKAMLNPFLPMGEEADRKAQDLANGFGATFVKELQRVRGTKLRPEVDYGTGEVWGGLEAKDLGLVDDIGTLDEIVMKTWGLPHYDFGPTKPAVPFLTASISDAVRSVVAEFFSLSWPGVH
jgi:protease IV